jgi:inner membrane protein
VHSLAHLLTSLVLARTGKSFLPRFGVAMLATSGLAPDLDYASYIGGPETFLRFHHTVFHSVLGAALTACVVAAAFCFLDKQWKGKPAFQGTRVPLTFSSAVGVCAVGVATHVLLDLSGGVGAQLLWPFRVHWFGWDLVPDFDPWILTLLLAGLLLPRLFHLVSEEIGDRREHASGARAAGGILIVLLLYLSARAALHSRALERLLSNDYHGREPLAAGAFPSAYTLLDWRGVVSTDATMEEIEVPINVNADFNSDRSLTYYKPEHSLALDIGQKTDAAQRFLSYAKFPLATVGRREDGYRFELHDLRFPPNDRSPENLWVRVDFDGAFQVQSERILFVSSP